MEKNLYIIAGCNGAGKTTTSFTILPDVLDCKEFVNADDDLNPICMKGKYWEFIKEDFQEMVSKQSDF